MTDTRRPAPAGAGRRVQPRLDESLTGSVSHEMSTSDLSAAMPGRHRIGTVASFGLECWPTSRRNGGRLPVGITGRLRRNTQYTSWVTTDLLPSIRPNRLPCRFSAVRYSVSFPSIPDTSFCVTGSADAKVMVT